MCACSLKERAEELRRHPRTYGVRPPGVQSGLCDSCYSKVEEACTTLYGPSTVQEMFAVTIILAGFIGKLNVEVRVLREQVERLTKKLTDSEDSL